MCVKLLTNNFLLEKAIGKSKDVHLAVLRVLPEVIRESVDADASSKSVIIYDPATGEKKMVSPTAVDGIESLGEVKTAEQREAEINARMQDTIQRGKDWLEGNVANPVGMQIQLGDGRIATIEAMHEDGKSAIATLPDGTQFMVSKDVLQRIVNNGQYADYKARRDAEAGKREAEQGTESAPETATEGGQPLPEEASTKEEESREYAQGDVFDVVVDGQKMHAEIVSPKDADGRFVVNVDDGESMRTLYVTPEELAAMEYREEPSTKAEETRIATEGSSEKALERGEQPTEEHTPTALERIPRDEKGNAQFHDVDTETAWDGLVEMSGNEETAHKVAEASLANAERKLKAAKALKEKDETPEELLRSIKENEAAAAEAQRVVDAWKAIVGEESRREEAAKAEAERIATEKAEAERKAAEERERAEAEEKTRIEAEKKEAERIAAEKAEEEARVEAERKAEEERKTEEEERKERDENGQPFVVSSDGTTTFGEITEDTGLTAAPIKLSEGFQDANTGKGYGLVHIEANHGEQIRQAGFTSVKEFVSFVATHYDPDNIRVGKRRDDGSDTFLIQVTDTHDNTLFIELSKDGSYWNVNSGGIFRKGYSNKKETVAKTEPQQPTNAVSSDSSLSANVKDGITNAEPNGEPTVSLDKGTTLPADQQTSEKENTKKVADSEGENTLKAKIEAASADVNTEPTEAQKKAGNYKKGHVQVGTFDITIEQPEGSIRRGTDADGKKWESKMHNTYGYFRGTEGVDGDHIDVFLSNDIDGWNGRKVFVVDQYNPDGTFDEHKVMLGFNDMDEAKSDYLANYEKGWENGRKITVSTTNLEDFEKWIDSSHRKTKPFSEYSSVNKGSEKAEKKQEKQSVFDKAKEIADKEASASDGIRFNRSEKTELTAEERELRDNLVERMRKGGLDVVTDSEEMQRVIDRLNERTRMMGAKQKRALETATIAAEATNNATVISSADGAKIQNNLGTLATNYEKIANKTRGFITDLSHALGLKQHESSQYGTFETPDGKRITIRVSNHNARVSNFDKNNESEGISIVISSHKNKGLHNDGNAHIIEYFYPKRALENAEGKPLAEMIRSVSDALAGEEFKDTTGLAEREEVNGSSVREHRVYHGSGADFDAFDHSHMGEGEGAQAYGWGTYVTEVEGIGRTYAIQNTTKHNDALRALQHDVDAISDQLNRHRDDLKYDEEQLKRANEWRAEAELDYELFKDEAEELKEKYGESSPKYRNHLFNDIYTDEMKRAQSSVKSTEESIQYRKEKISELEKALKDKQAEIDELPKEFPRHLYTVEIPDDNGSNYLDWNGHPAESLLKDVGSFLESEGFERVQDSPVRYEKSESTVVLNPNATGADLYAELREALGSDKKASQALAELGCIGIKYPADNMRGGREDGAKNYVIFNENDAKITDHTRFLRTAGGEVYGLVKDGRIYLDPKVATSETAVHEYTHLWGDMLRRKDSEQWSHTVKELKNSVLWEEVKESYPELKTDDEIADEVLSTFSGRRGAERLREEARRVADGEGGVFTKAKAIETLERVKEAIARFWEGVARMFGINRYRSAEELADMAMRDLINGVKPTSRTFTFDNFYKDTKAVFEGTERPKGKPDYISYSGSEYWYGEDKGGKYVVRGSDHWSGEFKVKDGERTNVGRNHYSEITEDGMLPIGAQGSLKFGWKKGLSKPVGSGISAAIDRRGSGDSNNIASCYWYIDNAKGKDNKGFTYGKAYLSEFEDKERRRDIPGDDWRDIQGLEGGTRTMAERIAGQPVEEINNRFNEELEKYQNNELPKGHRFELGMPSAELQSVGFPMLPISMRSSLLAKKAGAERHPFAPTDLRDLVNAIQKPIAIFKYSKDNMRNLIVDVSRGGKHFLVGVTLNYKADNIEINSVSGLFPKENHEWIKWIQDGKVLRIDQKEKVQDLINSLRTNPAESERIGLNLDDVAKKVKDFENPKLFGEEIIDDGKKGSDSIDRSVRENPKSEDKPRLSRKPGESIFDYASRVSESVDRSVRERVSARDEYEKKVKSKGFQTKEALQNSMLGLQEFMFAIDHASGNKRYIEDIPDFENPILGENRLSSVNKEEMHQVAKTQFKPLMSAVAKLSGNGKESGELYDYMFAKHGLERDAVMRQREAQKEFDKYQKANPKGTKTIGDFVASLEGKDYAGLTALTAEDGRVKSIQSQIDAIDEQMKATDDQLLLRKLGGQKKRLKVDLLNAARDAADDIRKAFESDPNHNLSDINELWKRVNEVNGNTLRKLYESGMLTKEAYNDISSMYTNYIPMRGFDQTTSADAYAYLTHGDSAFNAPIKTAKGRSSKADNPIAYMQAMAESAIMQGNRNVLVKQKMLNFVRNHPSDLASVSDVWLQYDSVADEWKPFYAFGRESKG